ESRTRGGDIAQIFLGNPQDWKAPVLGYPGGADALRNAAAEAGLDIVVHAPYLVNVASTNNRVRVPSRKILQQQIDLAAEVGAIGIVVHGGHVGADDDPSGGFDDWRKACERADRKVRRFIEHAAGGDHGLARGLVRIAGHWNAGGDLAV